MMGKVKAHSNLALKLCLKHSTVLLYFSRLYAKRNYVQREKKQVAQASAGSELGFVLHELSKLTLTLDNV
jgi:hypothetical protein